MHHFCPACSDERFTTIGDPKPNALAKEFIDKDYKVVQCKNCELYYVSPKISFNDEQWSKLYNEHYFSSQSDWLLKKRAIELTQRLDVAQSYIAEKEVKLLDVGCGEGKTLINGAERGWSVTGVDIVDLRNDEAKNEKINFIQGNFLELDLPENHYDFVYLDSVLEHVLYPLEYLEKIWKVLKKGGVVYIGVPNEDSLFNVIRRLAFNMMGRKNISVKIRPFDAPYHVNGFNNKSLKFILAKTNFSILKMRNFGRKMNFLSFRMNQRGYWIGLFILLPIEFIGKLFGKDVYYEVYIKK